MATYRVFEPATAQTRPPFKWMLVASLTIMMVLVLLSPLMSSPLMSQGGLPFTGDGNPARQGFYIFAAVVAAIGVRPTENWRRLLAVPLPVFLALLVCWISLTWSANADVGVRRLILTTAVVWTIFATTENLGFDQTIKVMRRILVIALFVNFLVVLGWPAIGKHQFGDPVELNLGGDWRGMMMHKNFAGALCAITVLFFSYYSRAVIMPFRLAVIIASAIFIAFSESKTSAGMALASIAIGFLYLRYNARYRIFMVFAILAVALVIPIYMSLYLDQTESAISSPYFFTGRGMIWRALLKFSNEHLMLGAGYGSFWNVGGSSPINQYATGWVTQVTSGHNGFLDLLAQIGLPGLFIVVMLLIVWPIGRLLKYSGQLGQRGAFALTLFIFCVGHNMTESSLLDRDSIPEVFLMLAIALIWKATAKTEHEGAVAKRPSRRRQTESSLVF